MNDHATHGHHDCGHNHDPNPYADPARARALNNILRSLFRLAVVTCVVDVQLSGTYAACTLVGVSDPSDRIPSYRAMLWEMGSIINVLSDGVEPEMHLVHADKDGLESVDADELDDPDQFLSAAQHAFFAAASVGDLASAVSVMDALHAEVISVGHDPEAAIAHFFGGVLVSVAFSARASGLNDH